ncbi:MAG: DUF2207 domain-containing protein, partial [Anaerolineae bacterium]
SETARGDEKIFVVEYDVIGGLWVYPDANTLEWRAVAADRSGVDVAASTVTVTVPFTLAADEYDVLVSGPDYTLDVMETAVSQQFIFTANDRLPDGIPFQVAVDFPPGLVAAELQSWQIAEDTAALAYSIDRVDVEMVVQEDGRLAISEQQQISVSDGIMYSGFRDLNWLFTDGITIERIAEGDTLFTLAADGLDHCENCYTVTEDRRTRGWVRYATGQDEVDINGDWAGATHAEWRFPALVRGESTTFTLDYLVDGATRINEDGTQEIAWTVIPGYDVPVGETQVRLRLPGRMGLEDVDITGGNVQYAEDGAILITPETAVSPNTSWQFTLTLPQGTTTAAKPTWQQSMEAAFAEANAYRARQARIDLAWLVGKIGVGMTAVLAAIVSWYLWGSRRLREMMGNYRTTPPSDLPPGLVAYLIDKKPTAKGALASLLYLANLGLIRVRLDEEFAIERTTEQKMGAGSVVTTPDGGTLKVSLPAARLFNALSSVLPVGKSVSLADIAPAFRAAMPQLYAAMGEEMVRYFYGDSDQEWRSLLRKVVPFIWFVSTAVFMFTFVSGSFAPGRNPAILLAGMAGGFAAMVFIMRRLERPRVSLSVLGKKEAQKWLGFKAYLQEISRFGTMPEAQEIMERYFAYALALGVDEALLAQAQKMGIKLPRWIADGRYPDGTPWHNETSLPQTRRRYGRWQRRWQRGSWLPRPPRPQTTSPATNGGGISLQGLSDQLTGSLAAAGSRMTTMLNTAVGDAAPVDVVIRGAGQYTKLEWEPGTSLDTMMRDIMHKTQSIKPPRPTAGSGGGGYSGGRRSGGYRSSGRSRSRRKTTPSARCGTT